MLLGEALFHLKLGEMFWWNVLVKCDWVKHDWVNCYHTGKGGGHSEQVTTLSSPLELLAHVLLESASSTHFLEHSISGRIHRGGGDVSHPMFVFICYQQKESVKLNIPSNFPVQFSSFSLLSWFCTLRSLQIVLLTLIAPCCSLCYSLSNLRGILRKPITATLKQNGELKALKPHWEESSTAVQSSQLVK